MAAGRSLNTNLSIKLDGTLTLELTDGSKTSVGFDSGAIGQNLQSGITANKANRSWASKGRTLTSGNSESIDLYDFGTIDIGAGAGKDMAGQAMALAKIVCLLIYNRATSAGNLVVGGEGTSATWSTPFNADDDAKKVVRPGGIELFYAPDLTGYAVTDAADHLLKLAAASGDVTYDIYVIGRTAS